MSWIRNTVWHEPLKKFHPWFSTVLLSDKMEEKVQQIQIQQEISNYKDEIRDLQEKLETLKVRKLLKIGCVAADKNAR